MGEHSQAIRHLRDYVAIPSVNPMRREDIPADILGERRYAEHVQAQLRALGLDAEVVGEGDRATVVGEATTADADETILVASHLDTVPVDGMDIDPFDPTVKDGRLYGRGSCDTKAGLAALMAALEKLLPAGKLKKNVVIVGEADEECGSVGVEDAIQHLGTRKPDWVLATEPTDMQVITHHKGICLVRMSAHGVACHSSDPSAGRSAIIALSKVILELDELHAKLRLRTDPILGHPTLSVGVIGGGQAPNMVPDHAWLSMDRRLLPDESLEQIRGEVEEAIRRAGAEGIEIEHCEIEKPALATDADERAVTACQDVLHDLGIDATPGTVAFGTDAPVFGRTGVPGVVFGPGSIAQAHTAGEYVEVDQVETTVRFYEKLLGG